MLTIDGLQPDGAISNSAGTDVAFSMQLILLIPMYQQASKHRINGYDENFVAKQIFSEINFIPDASQLRKASVWEFADFF